MSTRSIIARQLSDGSVQSIYCHWDGYPEHHLPILEGYYIEDNSLDALFALGNLSQLHRNIGEKHDFNDYEYEGCVAYHRDRDESWDEVKPSKFESVTAFRLLSEKQNYTYLFRHGARVWTVEPD